MSTPDGLGAAIEAALPRVRALLAPTPLQHSPALSERAGRPVHLKCEHVQPTGSFKVRGAANALTLLREAGHTRAVAASTGNHGMAAAHVAGLLGMEVEVYVPRDTAPVKLRGLRASGAAVRTVAGDAAAAEAAARAAAGRAGLPYLSPYNDPAVIAGQGTMGAEIAEQLPGAAAVYIAAGGGGMLSGAGAALRERAPAAQVVGCWPEAAPTLLRCIEAGAQVEVAEGSTLSDGTAGGLEPGAITPALAAGVMSRAREVSEEAIAEGMRELMRSDRWLVEGAAAVALAAALSDPAPPPGPAVVVLCGRNVDPEVAARVLADG